MKAIPVKELTREEHLCEPNKIRLGVQIGVSILKGQT